MNVILSSEANGGRSNSLGIATRYSVDRPGFELRWGRVFGSIRTSPETNPTSCIVTAGCLSWGLSGRVEHG